MSEVPEVDPLRAKHFFDEKSAMFVDIRDPLSYQRSHIPGALPLSDDNVQEFVATHPKDRPVIVCCYHGNSSRGATAFLLQQGFREVYSLQGGFEEWRMKYPEDTES